MTFINGALITNDDACEARNGIVHVVNSVIPSSSSTITDILCDDDRFVTFKALLNLTEISTLLDQNGKSRTVFAPTDDAFSDLPSGVLDCLLLEENRRALRSLLLVHISYPADYSSSLSL